ncbi:MAG: AraC family transcriptional regulator [Bradyrhizobiaceae bacterium]|nr:AraC family transcriptional regulator [Bradyrhizobiaceae bacterium]
MSNGSTAIAAAPGGELDPCFVDGRRMLVAGIAERYSGSNAGIPEQWRRFAPQIAKIPDQAGAATYGVIFDSLKNAYSFGYLSGVEVSSVARLPKEFCHLEIPAQRYAVFTHRDHLSALPRTMQAIMREWLPNSRHELVKDGADFFERYGDEFDPRTGTGAVELWIPIKH